MAYHSPLGSNFKLEASITAAKEFQEKATPESTELGLNNSRSDKCFQFEGRNSGNNFLNSPGWQRQTWISPNPRYSMQNESINISQYYHPSMVEDPWKDLADQRS